MAQIYKTPTKEQLYNELSDNLKTTLNKMLELQDVLINNPPNDKKFKKREFNYMLEYIDILNNVQFKDYSDEYVTNAINNLYDKVFKNRRY